MEITLDIAKLTEDAAEEMLFYNRKWLCGDLKLRIHDLRKAGNLLKLLRNHIKYDDVTLYPYLSSNKDLLIEQGSNKSKQDTWELSYRSIVHILFHYGIELRCIIDELDINPIAKLDLQIAKHYSEIASLERSESEYRMKIEDLEDELSDIQSELQNERESRNRLIEMKQQLEQLL